MMKGFLGHGRRLVELWFRPVIFACKCVQDVLGKPLVAWLVDTLQERERRGLNTAQACAERGHRKMFKNRRRHAHQPRITSREIANT